MIMPANQSNFRFSTTDSRALIQALLAGDHGRMILPENVFDDARSALLLRIYNICRKRIDENMSNMFPEQRRIIGFCFSDSSLLNAATAGGPGGYAIMLHDALIPLVYGFWRLFAEFDVMHISLEELLQKSRLPRITPKMAESWDLTNLSEFEEPFRNLTMWEGIRFTFNSIVDHEFAHVMRNHLDILRESEIIENGNGSLLGREKAKISQALELDADMFTAKHAVDSLFRRGYAIATEDNVDPLKKALYRNHAAVIRLQMVAMYVSFRLFTIHQDEMKNIHLRRHPLSAARFTNVSIEFHLRIAEIAPQWSVVAKEILDLRVQECIFCFVTGQRYDGNRLNYAISKSCKKTLLALRKELNSLIPRLAVPS